MKRLFWRWSGVLLVGLLVGLYTAFVAQCFWNWFAVPVLHLAEISFLQMLGILWLIQLLTTRSPKEDDKRWELLASLVELCVPVEKQTELADLKESDPLTGVLAGCFDNNWSDLWKHIYPGVGICSACPDNVRRAGESNLTPACTGTALELGWLNSAVMSSMVDLAKPSFPTRWLVRSCKPLGFGVGNSERVRPFG
jgi:hypothetical protein